MSPNKLWTRLVRRQSGFTLVEVIVAVAVVSIGILATVTVANVTVRAGTDNASRVTATNLAREGVELTRNVRDSNWAIRQAVPAQTNRAWNCYPNSAVAAAAAPFTCSDLLGGHPTNQVPYAVIPSLGAGVPYLVTTGAPEDIKDPFYRLCMDATRVYQPSQGPGNCAVGQTYYRMVRIGRAKRQGDGSYSIKVESYVTWPERKPQGTGTLAEQHLRSAIVIEEYFTDWRRVNSVGS